MLNVTGSESDAMKLNICDEGCLQDRCLIVHPLESVRTSSGLLMANIVGLALRPEFIIRSTRS